MMPIINPRLYGHPELSISYTPTSGLNKLMTKVTREINPCHRPAQKPAGSTSNRISPGAQDVKIKRARIMTGNVEVIFEYFMARLFGICEYTKYKGKTRTISG